MFSIVIALVTLGAEQPASEPIAAPRPVAVPVSVRKRFVYRERSVFVAHGAVSSQAKEAAPAPQKGDATERAPLPRSYRLETETAPPPRTGKGEEAPPCDSCGGCATVSYRERVRVRVRSGGCGGCEERTTRFHFRGRLRGGCGGCG